MKLFYKSLTIISVLLGIFFTHFSQSTIDPIRRSTSLKNELVFLPSGEAIKIASMGYHEPTADLLWIRAVLLFGERFGNDKNPLWGAWFAGMIKAINQLDPNWRTPYFYGGVMLRVIGLKDSSDEVFLAGHKAIPTDPFFPFAYGMNQYLLADDAETAAKWIKKAALIPSAPTWYKAAAGGLLNKKELRTAAIHFLKEEIDATEDPAVKQVLQNKLLRLIHDELALKIKLQKDEYESKNGSLSSLEVLNLPPDPHQGHWVIGADNEIRSSVREEEERLRAMKGERAWLLR